MKQVLFLLLLSLNACGCQKDSNTDSDEEIQTIAQLIACAKKNNVSIAKFILEKEQNGRTFLHSAAYEHDVESARFCIESGVPVDGTYQVGPGYAHKTALIEAFDSAFERRKFDTLPAIVQFLCDKDAPLPSLHWRSIYMRNCGIYSIVDPALNQSMNILAQKLKSKIESVKIN
jgi:hypothetical protein